MGTANRQYLFDICSQPWLDDCTNNRLQFALPVGRADPPSSMYGVATIGRNLEHLRPAIARRERYLEDPKAI